MRPGAGPGPVTVRAMSSALLFFLGLAAVVGAWVWLGRSNERDSQRLAQALGLALDRGQPAPERDRERGAVYARRVMSGELGGQPVEVWSRSFRPHRLSRSSRQETVVRVPLPRPSPQRLLLQPRALAALMDWGYGAPELPEIALDDSELDGYFQLRSSDATWARRLLDADARAALLRLRQILAPARHEVADFMADAAVLGALRIEPGFAELALRGTPQPTLAEAVRAAHDVLHPLAQRAAGVSTVLAYGCRPPRSEANRAA